MANNEIMAASSLKRLSEQEEDKISFSIPEEISFYSSVISHSRRQIKSPLRIP